MDTKEYADRWAAERMTPSKPKGGATPLPYGRTAQDDRRSIPQRVAPKKVTRAFLTGRTPTDAELRIMSSAEVKVLTHGQTDTAVYIRWLRLHRTQSGFIDSRQYGAKSFTPGATGEKHTCKHCGNVFYDLVALPTDATRNANDVINLHCPWCKTPVSSGTYPTGNYTNLGRGQADRVREQNGIWQQTHPTKNYGMKRR